MSMNVTTKLCHVLCLKLLSVHESYEGQRPKKSKDHIHLQLKT